MNKVTSSAPQPNTHAESSYPQKNTRQKGTLNDRCGLLSCLKNG